MAKTVKNLPTMPEIRFNPWVRKIPGKREWQSTPVFLPGQSHGQKSLAGYSPWGCKKSNLTEWLHKKQGGLVNFRDNFGSGLCFCGLRIGLHRKDLVGGLPYPSGSVKSSECYWKEQKRELWEMRKATLNYTSFHRFRLIHMIEDEQQESPEVKFQEWQ